MVNIPVDVKDYYTAHKDEAGFQFDHLVRTSRMEGGREVVQYSLQTPPNAIRALFSKCCCCFSRGAQTLRGRAAVDHLTVDMNRRAVLRTKFQSAVHRVAEKGFGKGLERMESQGVRGAILDDEYWQEALSPEHMGPEFTGRLRKTWERSSSTLSYEDWQKSPRGRREIEDLKVFLGAHLHLMHTDEAGRRSRVVDMDKLKVRYLSEPERREYEVKFEFREGKIVLVDAEGRVKPGPACGRYAFVMGADRKIYAGVHVVNQFHHSSFLGAQAVIAAGEIVVNAEGTVTEITNKSGHYKPTRDHMHDFLRMLQTDSELDLSSVTISFITGADTPPDSKIASDFYRSYTPRPVSGSSASPLESPSSHADGVGGSPQFFGTVSTA
jgi:hypothetical protein